MAADTADSQSKDACCYVVSFNLYTEKGEDGSVELIVRARNHWIFISIDPADLKTDKDDASPCLHQYEQLRDMATAAKKQNEAELIGKAHDEVKDEDEAAEEPKQKKRRTEYTDDSGYCSGQDQSQGEDGSQNEQVGDNSDGGEAEEDAEQTMQNWMLSPLSSQFAELRNQHNNDGTAAPPTLAQWYEVPTLFYALHAPKDDPFALEAVERTDLDEQKFRNRNLQNTLTLPKNLRNSAPWYSPEDISVLHETEDIHMSIHPTLVRLNSTSPDAPSKKEDEEASQKPIHFLKLVPSGPGSRHSVEREISILKKLADLRSKDSKLAKTLRFPSLQGLVAPPSTKGSHATILGFLLELIPSPRPLTNTFDEDIPQHQRDLWAKETRSMVECLHKHGITWGDAKADNFLVDEDGRLWMIDFGGGFTEGWIKEENLETRKGDREGVEKIENAVRDPVNATREVDGVASKEKRKGKTEEEQPMMSEEQSRKRKR